MAYVRISSFATSYISITMNELCATETRGDFKCLLKCLFVQYSSNIFTPNCKIYRHCIFCHAAIDRSCNTFIRKWTCLIRIDKCIRKQIRVQLQQVSNKCLQWRANDFLKSWDCKVLLYLNEKECFQMWNGRVKQKFQNRKIGKWDNVTKPLVSHLIYNSPFHG